MARQRNPASELILNKDGSVYHLNLKGENIANTVFLVGDPDRVPMVSRHFDFIDFETRHREFTTHTGRLSGKRFTVISTGIGTDNIDIVLNELEAAVNFDTEGQKSEQKRRKLVIIRIGTSGSIHEEIPVDSIVCSEYGLGLDGLVHYYDFDQTEEERSLNKQIKDHLAFSSELPEPYLFKGSEDLIELLGSDQTKGITVTSPGFYGPQGRFISIPLRHPEMFDLLKTFDHEKHKITNFEMETSAIYGLSKMLGHKACSISAILANRSRKEFSEDPEQSITKLIAFVLDRVVS